MNAKLKVPVVAAGIVMAWETLPSSLAAMPPNHTQNEPLLGPIGAPPVPHPAVSQIGVPKFDDASVQFELGVPDSKLQSRTIKLEQAATPAGVKSGVGAAILFWFGAAMAAWARQNAALATANVSLFIPQLPLVDGLSLLVWSGSGPLCEQFNPSVRQSAGREPCKWFQP
ncbi:MAG: hypothetical protein WAT76_12275 [Dokdonella sp.]|uniref:hypothetical protein n=1 Tax=Dokdonella sp. TaxID=2291710 RepID=UPI003BB18D5A